MRRAGAQVALQFFELSEKAAHAHVGVDPLFETAAVSGAALRLHFDPEITFVGQGDLHWGRLGDDCGVGFDVPDHIGGADAAVLFIGDGGDHDIAAEARAGIDERFNGGHLRREAAFHVITAAAVHPAVANGGGEGALHAVDADGIVMRIEHQAFFAAGAAQCAEHADPAGFGFELANVETQRSERKRDVIADFGLALSAREERRVDGVDADQVRGRLEEIITIYFHFNLWFAILPPTMLYSTSVLRMSSSGIVRMSLERTVMWASIPGLSAPCRCS